MNISNVIKEVFRSKKKILVSAHSALSTVFSCYYHLFLAAATGSGLSNADDKTTLSYWLSEQVVNVLFFMIAVIPLMNLVGLIFYWKNEKKKFAHLLMFSGIHSIFLYSILGAIIAMIYMAVSIVI